MTVALHKKPLAHVVKGIVIAAGGAIYDIQNLSTLYQDDAGTVPVTATGQSVGKVRNNFV